MIRRWPALAAAAALGACSLDPHYVRPAPAVPPSWPVGDAYLRSSEATLPSVDYRQIFRDPHLQVIIATALTNNQDLRIAAANIESARAQYRVQRAQLLPQIGAAARVSQSTGPSGSAGTGATSSSGGTAFDAQVGVTAFEVDVFGRIRSLARAALQQYLATAAAARTVRLTLVADIADAYLTLASDRSLLAIAADTEQSAQRSVDLTRARLDGGVAPRTDLRQAESVLYQARVDRANTTTLVAQDCNALELLVGAPVADADLPASIDAVGPLVAPLPAGVDSRVLLRRPDVVEAEYSLRAANARIGAARASFFPTINLTAAAGFASTALSTLFTGGAFSYSVAPAVAVPLFDGGANRGNLAYARAQRDLAVATYQKTIQTAFREVADALARRGTVEAQAAAQLAYEQAADDAARLETARYLGGIDPYLNALVTQRTLYAARQSLATARLLRAQSLVALYRALGGDQLLDPPPPPR